jgi:proteasome lid subunit RPN8/RPN11
MRPGQFTQSTSAHDVISRPATALSIPSTLVRELERHALESLPEECCGVLIGRIEGDAHIVEEVRPAANVSPDDRTRAYEIEPQAVFECFRDARRTGRHVLGFYHSHPDGTDNPSDRDRDGVWPHMSYVIVPVAEGRVAGLRSWNAGPAGGPFIAERIN